MSFICSKGGKYNDKNKTKADVLMPKEKGSGFLEPSDFRCCWWCEKPESASSEIDMEQTILGRIEAQVLNPLILKGKGQPKGSKGKQKGHGESGKYHQFTME